MSITCTWTFPQLEYEDRAGFQSAVVALNWCLIGVSAEGITASLSGRTPVGPPAEDNFMAVDELTVADVVAWLPAETVAEAIASVENKIAAQIAREANNAGTRTLSAE